MKHQIMGKKRGMLQMYDAQGNLVVCTLVEAKPNLITQVKTKETDGYTAVQIAAHEVPAKRVKNISKPLRGHFKKAGVNPRYSLEEVRIEAGESFEVGQTLTVSQFSVNELVDVTGTSKGKGFQGVMKRHGFRGGPAAHGSKFHRAPGSTGMRTSPGRCLPGTKLPGQMGNEKVTVQNLRVHLIDEEKNVIVVEGAIPGANGSDVVIRRAMKTPGAKQGVIQ